jgi:hypothetical protein
MKQLAVLVLGALVALTGAVWTLQCLGYINGSFMTGATLWAVIGPMSCWPLATLPSAPRQAAVRGASARAIAPGGSR